MKILDFRRSAVFFQVDVDRVPPRTLSHRPPFAYNNARVELDSRLLVTERESGATHTFVLGVSCKTERVGAETDLWLVPNADFVPIFSDTRFMHVKTFARAGTTVAVWPPGSGEQTDRLVVPISDAFAGAELLLTEHDAEILSSRREIVDATLANRSLVGLVTIESDRYMATIEFPVKTMNANERDVIYQTDTGPVLFPDLARDPDELLGAMELAFVATNDPTWAEFIVRTRTTIADSVDVYHYSTPIRIDDIRAEICTFPSGGAGQERRVRLPARQASREA
jgi:hypothetical protein